MNNIVLLKKVCYTQNNRIETFGVLYAEIIPMEPDTVRTGAGKCSCK